MIVNNLKMWHKIVCSGENYVCRVCKKDHNFDVYFNEDGVNAYVCGHHYPHTQKARPDLVLETENGVCICFECHTKAHKGLVNIPEKEEKGDKIEPFLQKNRKNVTIPLEFDHILPSGLGIHLRGYEKLCKCKKYIAQEVSGTCFRCEKRIPTNFKVPKKSKS